MEDGRGASSGWPAAGASSRVRNKRKRRVLLLGQARHYSCFLRPCGDSVPGGTRFVSVTVLPAKQHDLLFHPAGRGQAMLRFEQG